MTLTINAHITADVSTLGKTARTVCDGTVTYNSLGQPDTIKLIVDAPTVNVINAVLNDNLADRMLGTPVSIVDGNGIVLKSKLSALTRIEPGENTLNLTFVLDRSETTRSEVTDHTVRTWSFCLSNVRLRRGDERVDHPAPALKTPPGVVVHGGFSMSAIRFTVAGREWRLVDTHFRMPRKERDALNIEPVASGELTVAACENETLESVLPIATKISSLLTLALSRDIKIISAAGLDANNHVVRGIMPSIFVHPSGKGQTAIVDNDDYRMLADFIGRAYAEYAADPAWWQKSIGMFFESRVTSYIDVGSTILNVLLDRITTRVVGDAKAPEIDEKLDEVLGQKEFQDELHAVLSKLSGNWEKSRTDAIVSKIREFNAQPSFPKKVQTACASLGVAPPAAKSVSPRHKLLHLGELIAKDVFDYWRDLDALVVQMLLRMLGYDGKFYHFKYGQGDVLLSETRKTAVDA